MSTDEVIFERKKLYGQVWDRPLTKLAEKYGVPTATLTMACRQLGIPRPGVGHWSRVAHGKKVLRRSLPPLQPGAAEELRVPRPQPRTTDASFVTGNEPAGMPTVMVRSTLEGALPVVLRTQKKFRTAKKAANTELLVPGEPALDVRVGKDSIDRALRIMDALISALAEHGAKVKLRSPRRNDGWDSSQDVPATTPFRTSLKVDGEWVGISIVERCKVVQETPTPPQGLRGANLARWKRWDGRTRTSYVPKGLLEFRIEAESKFSGRRTWKDTKTKPLEVRLPSVVAGILAVPNSLKHERTAAAELQRQHQERERRWLEQQRRRRAYEKRGEELQDTVKRWRVAEHIRAYVAEARTVANQNGTQTGQLQQDLAWALEYADRMNPLTKLRRAKDTPDG